MASKLLINCANAFEANIIKSKLDDAEIFCFITNENFSSIMPHFYNMLGSGVRVMVNEEDYDTAIQLIGVENTTKLCCPKCNSTNIKTSLGSGKFKKIFTIIISILIFVPINNINMKYICEDCKNEFQG